MTATFLGGALGTVVSGWLMGRFGWSGVVALGLTLGGMAAVYHHKGAITRAQDTPA
jgi:MFS family permease